MKKIFIFLFILLLNTIIVCADDDLYYKVNIDNKKFLRAGFFDYYDIKTYRYNSINKMHKVDYMYEYHPRENEDIECPLGDGYISNFIFSISFSEKTNQTTAKYKGFVCAVDNFGIYSNGKESNKPVKIFYNSDIKLLYPYIKKEKDLLPDFEDKYSKEALKDDLKYINSVVKVLRRY